MTKISMTSLGCPKNLVDSEIIMGLLKKSGMEICNDAESSDIMLINTCSFIKSAKEESIDSILQLAKIKQKDPDKKIVVIGCLVQRYLKELQKEIPEVDLWITLQEIPRIPEFIKGLQERNFKKQRYSCPRPSSFLYNDALPRYMITPKYYAYIKIAEGCSNLCSYCAVPNIKGRYKSRELESILREAEELTKKGVKEINLIAQDTTSYGKDLSGKINLTALLKKLCAIKTIKWIRLLYTHPAHITDDLIEEIVMQEKICKYIDLPLQHIDNDILKKMGRKTDSSYIKKLIKKIRSNIPSIVLRTSFIVGFPGETETKFKNLLEFIEETRFERLGVFTYSREDGTAAYGMPDQVPAKTKERRFHETMLLQNNIAKEVNNKFLDSTMDVLIENSSKNTSYNWVGRTYADAPEVDGFTYISGNNIRQGDIIKAKIIDTLDYDLIGKAI